MWVHACVPQCVCVHEYVTTACVSMGCMFLCVWHLCVQLHICVCPWGVCVCVSVCLCISVCLSLYMQPLCVRLRVCVCVCVCLSVCLSICVCVKDNFFECQLSLPSMDSGNQTQSTLPAWTPCPVPLWDSAEDIKGYALVRSGGSGLVSQLFEILMQEKSKRKVTLGCRTSSSMVWAA